jgi:uncharacterized membrane protein
MPSDTTIVFGIPVPLVDPIFLVVVRFHILVGIVCVVAAVVAMLSNKGRGRHSTFGTLYYWCLATVVASATGLSVVRWAENYHLFFLGALSLIAATIARAALGHGAGTARSTRPSQAQRGLVQAHQYQAQRNP